MKGVAFLWNISEYELKVKHDLRFRVRANESLYAFLCLVQKIASLRVYIWDWLFSASG